MLVWTKAVKKPSESGAYLVLVRLKDSERYEYDIATWVASTWKWDTNYWQGDVVWWTELPDKESFTDEYARYMKRQENT